MFGSVAGPIATVASCRLEDTETSNGRSSSSMISTSNSSKPPIGACCVPGSEIVGSSPRVDTLNVNSVGGRSIPSSPVSIAESVMSKSWAPSDGNATVATYWPSVSSLITNVPSTSWLVPSAVPSGSGLASGSSSNPYAITCRFVKSTDSPPGNTS